jgi:hypothetical protein
VSLLGLTSSRKEQPAQHNKTVRVPMRGLTIGYLAVSVMNSFSSNQEVNSRWDLMHPKFKVGAAAVVQLGVACC